MHLRTAAATILVALTAACGGSATTPAPATSSGGADELTGSDRSISVDAPDGWDAVPDQQQGKIVLVAQGADPLEQLIVSREPGTSDAYDNALFTVTGLTSDGADCTPGTIDGHESFDCADEFEGQPFHRVFVAVEAGEGSYGFLVQTPAESSADADAVVTPIIESINVS